MLALRYPQQTWLEKIQASLNAGVFDYTKAIINFQSR